MESPFLRGCTPGRFAAYALLTLGGLLAILWLAPARAHAQEQESGLLNRILHPDTSMQYVPAEKKFGSTSQFGGKSASTRSFPFSHPAGVAGDGKFRTRGFVSQSYTTREFGQTDKSLNTRGFSQTNKLFDTRDFSVREARDANKSMRISSYGRADRTFSPQGKRQGSFDYILSQKNLTIDQVRDLLNKNK